jgi:hypothetical protein
MGKLRSPSLVPELVADLRGRAVMAGWPFKDMATLVAERIVECTDLTGISLYPHEACEPVRLHFDVEGVLVEHTYQALLAGSSKTARMMREAIARTALLTQAVRADSKAGASADRTAGGFRVTVPDLPEDFGSSSFLEQARRYVWTKTQGAGPDVHIAVCELLRHVKDRYAPDLKITDDAGYFEHGNRDELLAQFAYVDHITSTTANAFRAVVGSKTPPKGLDDLLNRVNEELSKARDKLH